MSRPRALRSLALVIGFAWALPALAYEQPAYGVVRSDGPFELRRYAPYVVAETFVEGDFGEVGNEAFRRLAAYIGGENRTRAEIAMTAPVTQESGSARIAMTAPVTQEAEGARYRFAFVMPAAWRIETLPEPLDARIALREQPGRLLAVVRYRGTWRQARYAKQLARLRGWIAASGLEATGSAPVWARYDPPFMPWFLRRNEIWIEVGEPPALKP